MRTVAVFLGGVFLWMLTTTALERWTQMKVNGS